MGGELDVRFGRDSVGRHPCFRCIRCCLRRGGVGVGRAGGGLRRVRCCLRCGGLGFRGVPRGLRCGGGGRGSGSVGFRGVRCCLRRDGLVPGSLVDRPETAAGHNRVAGPHPQDVAHRGVTRDDLARNETGRVRYERCGPHESVNAGVHLGFVEAVAAVATPLVFAVDEGR